MFTKTQLAALIALCLSCVLTGCASHSTQVIARCGPQPMPARAGKIAVLKQAAPSPEDEALQRAVADELKARGFHIVLQTQSELSLACHVEENCHRYGRIVMESPPGGTRVQVIPGVGPVLMEQPPMFPSPPRYVEDTVDAFGIRVQVYPTQQLLAGRFETAWDGYIEAGLRLRPEQRSLLLRKLLDYFGREFSGKVRLPDQH